MMNWFAESPWPGIGLGLLLAVMLASGYLQTGRKSLLFGAIICLLLGAALACLESQIVTDREQVEETIRGLAEALEEQRDADILNAIHPLSTDIQRRADSELRLYVFERVDIKNNLRVEVDLNHQPPKATARFNVVARVKAYPQNIPRFVELEFTQDTDGKWKIRDYRHAAPQEGFMKQAK